MKLWNKLRSSTAHWVFTWYAKKRKEADMIGYEEEFVTDDYEITAELFEPYLPAANSGYIRPMQEVDLIDGSSARVGWFGYFDGDGDIVFWASSSKEALQIAHHEHFDVYNVH